MRSVNPAGLVYSTVTVATPLAAEGPRRESYPATTAAVALTMALHWLAHSYSLAKQTACVAVLGVGVLLLRVVLH